MIRATGWSWEYLDESVTWPMVESMYRHLEQHPATHDLVAGLAGYKPPIKPEAQTLEQLFAAFAAAGGTVIH